jgi:hypothetical protein
MFEESSMIVDLRTLGALPDRYETRSALYQFESRADRYDPSVPKFMGSPVAQVRTPENATSHAAATVAADTGVWENRLLYAAIAALAVLLVAMTVHCVRGSSERVIVVESVERA